MFLFRWIKRLFSSISLIAVLLFSYQFIYIPFFSPKASASDFTHAKLIARQKIYYDRIDGTLYCGCDYMWDAKNRSSAKINLKSCGYSSHSVPKRASRLEWEHIVPAHVFGHNLICWQNGRRKQCKKDKFFNSLEGNLFNIAPSIGEVNAERSNFNYGKLPNRDLHFGQCKSKVNAKLRLFEPRDEVKGMVARTYFYMADRYNLSLSHEQADLLMSWDKQFPVSPWEREREKRIAKIMGHHNEFVTGQRKWNVKHKNSGDGLK